MMSLKNDLPKNLYNTFEVNNLLPIIGAITNEYNLISIDLYDIESFDKKKYIGRIDYTNKDSILTFPNEANSLLMCFDINQKITLGEIAKELDKLYKIFNINEVVYGTNLDDTLEDGLIRITCLMFE